MCLIVLRNLHILHCNLLSEQLIRAIPLTNIAEANLTCLNRPKRQKGVDKVGHTENTRATDLLGVSAP